jgi:hypothetical protein
MAKGDIKRVRYEVFGPFAFERLGLEKHPATLKRFWAKLETNDVDARHKSLADAVGIYVWTYKKGKKRLPWNVGLTDRQGFKARFKQKARSFLEFYEVEKRAKIEVFLLALTNHTGGFRKPTRGKGISRNDWLEGLLIGSAIAVNPALRNAAKVGKLKSTVVDGYLNDDGRNLGSSAKLFSAIFKA